MSDCDNYRLISLTCVSCRVMKRLIATDVLSYLRTNLVKKHQCGFLSTHFTCTQIIEAIGDWSIAFRNMFIVALLSAYLEFTKAFDTVSHRKLIYKMKCYEINGHLLI